MTRKPDLFLDTSALFAGIWSESGGARQLLKLGELELVRIVLCPQVLKEIEAALRSKAPQTLGRLAILLDRVQIYIAPSASKKWGRQVQGLVDHSGDAKVLAAAWQASVHFFVTLDRQHFLDNDLLRRALPFPLGTPGDALQWARERLVPGSS